MFQIANYRDKDNTEDLHPIYKRWTVLSSHISANETHAPFAALKKATELAEENEDQTYGPVSGILRTNSSNIYPRGASVELVTSLQEGDKNAMRIVNHRIDVNDQNSGWKLALICAYIERHQSFQTSWYLESPRNEKLAHTIMGIEGLELRKHFTTEQKVKLGLIEETDDTPEDDDEEQQSRRKIGTRDAFNLDLN